MKNIHLLQIFYNKGKFKTGSISYIRKVYKLYLYLLLLVVSMNTTTVKISPETKSKLKDLKRGGESYEDVISSLISTQEMRVKKETLLRSIEEVSARLLKERKEKEKIERLKQVLQVEAPGYYYWTGSAGYSKDGYQIKVKAGEKEYRINKFQKKSPSAGVQDRERESDLPEIHDLPVLCQLGAIRKKTEEDSLIVTAHFWDHNDIRGQKTSKEDWEIQFKYPSLEIISEKGSGGDEK